MDNNFLESEVGLVLKTAQISGDSTGVKEENGTKYLPAGTIFPGNDATAKGIVFTQTDVTNGEHAVSIMVAGRIHPEKLPKTLTDEAKIALMKQGFRLIFEEPSIRKKEYLAYGPFSASDIATSLYGKKLMIIGIDDSKTDKKTAEVSYSPQTHIVTPFQHFKSGETTVDCIVSDGDVQEIVTVRVSGAYITCEDENGPYLHIENRTVSLKGRITTIMVD